MKWRFNLGMLAIGAVLFASCSSNDDLFDPEKAAQRREAQYTTAFAKLYGEIAPDQDWGFGKIADTRGVVKHDQHPQIDDVIPPSSISSAEIAYVTEWFSKNQYPTSINVEWTDFTIQNISSTSYGSKMNLLYAKNEHVLDFNSGSGNAWRLLFDSGLSFSYHNSEDNGTYYDYTIQYIPGNGTFEGGYYVGFDYQANGQSENQKVALNGYYNDWILKIAPAKYKDAKRVIAEDLGEIGDFDFNDVVFDVASYGGSTIITLQAAGGTLPLYIRANGEDYEVHGLFGVSTTTMVNTVSPNEKAPVMFRIPGVALASDIDIVVKDQIAGEYPLTAEVGEAPKKICVETRYEWTKERQRISDKYELFERWVKDRTFAGAWY